MLCRALAVTGNLLLAASGAAQTVDEVITRSLEARGGLDALRSIQSVRMTGQMSVGDTEAALVVEMKRPGRYRVDVTFDAAPSVQAFDGKAAWGVPPMGLDAQALPAEAAREMVDQADFEGPLVDYAAKGNTVELVGRETLDGREAWKLRVTRGSGDVELYFLDAGSYLPVRIESRRTVRGTVVRTETELGDYREAGGFLWPFTIHNSARGRPEKQKISFRKIEANVPIDDRRFQMPARPDGAPRD